MNTDTDGLVPGPDATPVSAPPSALHKIFIGKDGLRAGWSLLIFIALLAAMFFSVTAIGHQIYPAARKATKTAAGISATPRWFISEFVPFLVTLFVTWVMAKIERRPNAVYGLGGKRKLPHFIGGLFWGVACLSMLLLTLWRTEFLVIDRRLLSGFAILRYGTIWLLGFLMVGLSEEYLLRGYVQYTLSRGLAGFYRWAFNTRHSVAMGFWTSAVLFSVVFGLSHSKNPGESPLGLLSAGLAGIVFCLSLWRTGSLWWAIGFHTAWDWAQSFLYGVADSGTMIQHHFLATHPVGNPLFSGGATGPEGSIFALAILALTSFILMFSLPDAHERD